MRKDEKLKKRIAQKIGNAIKFYRCKNDLSQEKLAELVEVDRTYISALEQGIKCASVYCLVLIAKELKIKVSELLDVNI